MKKVLFITLSVLLLRPAMSQDNQLFYNKVDTLLGLFDGANYSPISFDDTSLLVIDRISRSIRHQSFADRSKYLDDQAALYRRTTGLRLMGSYLENINPTIGDLEENLNYQRRFQAGIEWQLLDGGFLENKVKAKITEDRMIREKMQMDARDESGHYLKRFDQTIYVFNVLKIDLLYQRKRQLERQYNIVKDLVLLKKLPKEEQINMDTRLSEVQSLINVYQSYNDYLRITTDSIQFEDLNLPLIDLDYEMLFGLIEVQTDSLLAEHEYKEYYKWYHEISLRPYARYNYYDLVAPAGNRTFISAGVNVSVPIPFNTKLRNRVENEKWKFDNDRLVKDRLTLHEDILNTGYEFRYKLKQFINFYQKREVFMERLRIEKVKVRLQDVNIDPLAGLALYDDLLSIDIELIDLLQNLYLKALKIHSKIPRSDIRDIIKSQPIKEVNEYIDNKKKSVYVWSKTFADYSPEFLTEYVTYNGFEKVVVAAMLDDTLKEQRTRFMNYCKERGEVHLMIGSNEMFYSENIIQDIVDIIKNYPEVEADGIHLDIEPHTFEDWASDKQILQNQYVELVGKVSTFCKENGFALSISIPLHYGQETIDKLFPKVDAVYFMCYENVKTDYLIKKVTPFVDNASDKIVLAFRTEDFENRIGLEEKLQEIATRTHLRSFAYHDLRRMVEFDMQSIKH